MRCGLSAYLSFLEVHLFFSATSASVGVIAPRIIRELEAGMKMIKGARVSRCYIGTKWT